MKWPVPLQQGVLIKRYKRFLADIQTRDGRFLTIHCPNTGSMRNCGEAGSTVWFWDSEDPKRKLPCTWELVDTQPGGLACINTQRANQVVKEALSAGSIPALADYAAVKAEVKYGSQNSRVDFLLTHEGLPDCYVEVKSVTLKENGTGYFPDAVSSRATRHLQELEEMITAGHRAVLLFAVMHTGIDEVRPAAHIDPAYAAKLREAIDAGVEVMAWKVSMNTVEVCLAEDVPVLLD
ncbi:DNA/RNA nuclease SfsA [Pokkaliibacter sp. CJK22405]|uniref:DNA/RNA nuclease SfsA n=1 Tax=Pokkaliibacter sp. CJK22405 TaxID=3384615 RepID=UPI0039851F35